MYAHTAAGQPRQSLPWGQAPLPAVSFWKATLGSFLSLALMVDPPASPGPGTRLPFGRSKPRRLSCDFMGPQGRPHMRNTLVFGNQSSRNEQVLRVPEIMDWGAEVDTQVCEVPGLDKA